MVKKIYFTTKTGQGELVTTPEAVLPSMNLNSDVLLIPITIMSIFFSQHNLLFHLLQSHL